MDPNTPIEQPAPLFERVVSILEQAKGRVVRSVNSQMVIAYWLIGREIVEDEQEGKVRAEYGKRLIQDLSRRLTERYGKSFSVSNIRNFRQFYIIYQNRDPEIRYPLGGESIKGAQGKAELEKHYPLGGESMTGFNPDLSWSHYRALMRIEN